MWTSDGSSGPSDNPEEWDDPGELEEDDEFEEDGTLIVTGFMQELDSEEEEPDVVDQLHAVVKEVSRYEPPARTDKPRKLPTIGFIQ